MVGNERACSKMVRKHILLPEIPFGNYFSECKINQICFAVHTCIFQKPEVYCKIRDLVLLFFDQKGRKISFSVADDTCTFVRVLLVTTSRTLKST